MIFFYGMAALFAAMLNTRGHFADADVRRRSSTTSSSSRWPACSCCMPGRRPDDAGVADRRPGRGARARHHARHRRPGGRAVAGAAPGRLPLEVAVGLPRSCTCASWPGSAPGCCLRRGQPDRASWSCSSSPSGRPTTAERARAGPAIFNNAFLIFMMAHGIVAVSIITALMPRMSAAAAEQPRTTTWSHQLSLGTRLAAVVLIPATVALRGARPAARGDACSTGATTTTTQAIATGWVIARGRAGPGAVRDQPAAALRVLRDARHQDAGADQHAGRGAADRRRRRCSTWSCRRRPGRGRADGRQRALVRRSRPRSATAAAPAARAGSAWRRSSPRWAARRRPRWSPRCRPCRGARPDAQLWGDGKWASVGAAGRRRSWCWSPPTRRRRSLLRVPRGPRAGRRWSGPASAAEPAACDSACTVWRTVHVVTGCRRWTPNGPVHGQAA